jgi:hypothetical protein
MQHFLVFAKKLCGSWNLSHCFEEAEREGNDVWHKVALPATVNDIPPQL